MSRKYLTWNEIIEKVNGIKNIFVGDKVHKIYGIPRGGAVVAGILYCRNLVPVDNIEDCDIIVDDVYDTGRTTLEYEHYKKPMIYLVDKRIEYSDEWVVFPWEIKE